MIRGSRYLEQKFNPPLFIMNCPLCTSTEVQDFAVSAHRQFFTCMRCSLVFTDPENLPAPGKERERYEQHHNSKADEGYVNFLNQAITPALQWIGKNNRLLDYGCGPAPVLSQLLRERGLSCENYDPFFYPPEPEGKFDCIFSTETFEHFHHPGKELLRLKNLLNPDGLLVIMTDFYRDATHFKTWWYARDFTHVSFYHPETFGYICDHFDFYLNYTDGKRIAILRDSTI